MGFRDLSKMSQISVSPHKRFFTYKYLLRKSENTFQSLAYTYSLKNCTIVTGKGYNM